MGQLKMPSQFIAYPEAPTIQGFDLNEQGFWVKRIPQIADAFSRRLSVLTQMDRDHFDAARKAMETGKHNAEKAADYFRASTGQMLDQEGGELPPPLEMPIQIQGDFKLNGPRLVWTTVMGSMGSETAYHGFQVARSSQLRLLFNLGLFTRDDLDDLWRLQAGIRFSGITAENDWVGIDRLDFLGTVQDTQPTGYIKKPEGWLIGTQYFVNGDLEGSGLHNNKQGSKRFLLGRHRSNNCQSSALESSIPVTVEFKQNA